MTTRLSAAVLAASMLVGAAGIAAADSRMGMQPPVSGGVTVSWFTGKLGRAAGSAQFGYEIGTWLPLRIREKLEFRPGLSFTTKGAEAHREITIPILDQNFVLLGYQKYPIDWNLNLAYIEAPMLLRSRLSGTEFSGWRVSAGVAPGVRVGASPSAIVTGVGTNLYPQDARWYEVTGIAGIGYDWAGSKALSSAEVRLKYGFTDVFDPGEGPAGKNAAVLLAGSIRLR